MPSFLSSCGIEKELAVTIEAKDARMRDSVRRMAFKFVEGTIGFTFGHQVQALYASTLQRD